MADLNIVRKAGPTLWPWLIGLVVLGLLIWGISELVNTDRDNATMAEADADVSPVATGAVPGSGAQAVEQTPPVTPAPLAALMPLGTQDVGQRVSVTGEVLTNPADGGFWVRTENRAVIWVKGPQRVKEGQQVQEIVGTIQQVRAGQPGAALDAEIESSAAGKGVAFAPGLYLDASPGPNAAPAAARTGSRNEGGRDGTEARARPGSTRRAGTDG